MSRGRTLPRCESCLLLQPLCLCDEAPKFPAQTEIVLVMHTREWQQVSNTGRVAALRLERVEVHPWGPRDRPIPSALAPGDRRTVLLYPGPEASPLTGTVPLAEAGGGFEAAERGPARLLVPDGTWKQTKRIARSLAKLPGVELATVSAPPEPVLRRTPAADRLPTGLAIAAALEALGEPDAAEHLRRGVRALIDRSLYIRGKIGHAQVRGGVPLEVRRALSSFPSAPGAPDGSPPPEPA